jgi:predicted NAD/FAD-binding protein
LALYDELGVETDAIAHSCSFTVHGASQAADTFLHYGVGPEGTAQENVALSAHGRLLVQEHARFVANALRDHATGATRGKSLGDYVAQMPVSDAYVAQLLIPSFAGICTCRFAVAERFPADVALDLLLSGTSRIGLRRMRGGAATAAQRFVERLTDFRGGTRVRRVERLHDGVRVLDDAGREASFDHVVVATPAKHVAGLVALSSEERAALDSVRYERTRVVVHRDDTLVPPVAKRGAFNFVFDAAARETSATIWVNAIQSGLEHDTFQTVNPILEPRSDTVIHDITLERAAVDSANLDIGARVDALHRDPARRVWFCGSYARRGVPLLETGVASANAVARSIDERAGIQHPTP